MRKILFVFLLWVGVSVLEAQKAQTGTQSFELIALPYATDALKPVISQQTVELHHGKHLRGYVNKLNSLIEGTKFEGKSLRTIVRTSGGGVFDNAGQLLNHNLYFLQFIPGGYAISAGPLQDQILIQFGSMEEFKAEFEREGMSLFGSGWLWLSRDKVGKLVITKEPNGSNPVVRGLEPMLGVDLWEHAYYLDYQNKRAEHLKALWSIIDWRIVAERYAKTNVE